MVGMIVNELNRMKKRKLNSYVFMFFTLKKKGGRVKISRSTLTLDGSVTLSELRIYNDYVSSLVHKLIHYLTFVNYDKKVNFSRKK